MDFISVRDFRQKSAEIWERLRQQGDLVITSNGKPIAIMSSASESKLEEELLAVRQARANIALRSLQLHSVKREVNKLSSKDIEDEITSARKSLR